MLSFSHIAARIFGTSNDRKVKAFDPKVAEINALEAEIEALSDDELRARTDMFRQQLADGATLDSLLVPAFATVREAAKRTLGQRHFDVQMKGGMVLHEGKIAEMKTGEGKTLVATLPVYLNALMGRGVHVVTVNDYLARRDSEWMGQVYRFLGLTVGVIVHELNDDQRREQYACDVTYGTNNELGFDYLRDNMKMSADEMVQFGGRPAELRAHAYAIVDEVDSILIDEARTPLIISGPLEDRSELYTAIDKLMPKIEKEDYDLDEKQKQVAFTEVGNQKLERLLAEAELLKSPSLYDIENVTAVHHAQQALKAHKLFHKDRDYIVKGGQVVIIDEFTGRMMPGRRYSEGLHQALEAKEKVDIQPENQTLASITFQNYFRLYEKLAGMTGTATTEASEFSEIYGLDVVEMPTNLPVARLDMDDEVYRTAREKWDAIIRDVESAQARNQPVLVGTVSIEKSEMLSELLKKKGIRHQVLNARYHEQEAAIIAQAGVPGSVTIATNMAGRGTDIQLGGNASMRIAEETASITGEAEREKRIEGIYSEISERREQVLNASETVEVAPAKGNKPAKTATYPGGLYVIGTERHESRRIDNQLRGRSGRQGDPGRTRFYLSLEDDLMRIFGGDRLDGLLKKLGMSEGEAITSPIMNKALANAQKKVEGRNFESRKYVLKYDDVMNDQRKAIFEQRLDIMGREDVSDEIVAYREQVIEEMVTKHIPEGAYAEQWDVSGLKERVKHIFGLDLPIDAWANEEGIAETEIRERLTKAVDEKVEKIASEVGGSVLGLYDQAKGMHRFVESEPELKRLVESDPAKNAAAIGRFLLNSKRGELRIQGGTLDDAANQAEAIGYSFLRDYFESQSFTQAVESSEDRSPATVGRLQLRGIEKSLLLETLDRLWREHLVTLEHLRQVIHFRGYAQRDPLNEYKSEGFQLFEGMVGELREEVTGKLMHLEFKADGPPPAPAEPAPLPPMTGQHLNPLTGEDEFALAEAVLAAERSHVNGRAPSAPMPQRAPEPQRQRQPAAAAAAPAVAADPANPETWGRVARNQKCPCGSGKKYKHCHGR